MQFLQAVYLMTLVKRGDEDLEILISVVCFIVVGIYRAVH